MHSKRIHLDTTDAVKIHVKKNKYSAQCIYKDRSFFTQFLSLFCLFTFIFTTILLSCVSVCLSPIGFKSVSHLFPLEGAPRPRTWKNLKLDTWFYASRVSIIEKFCVPEIFSFYSLLKISREF